MLTGAALSMNSTNPISAAAEMMMLGGSAMTVDTPPMLEAKIYASRNGTGSTSSIRQIENVIGTAITTTVTLSRNAEAAAVSADISKSVRKPLPPAS